MKPKTESNIEIQLIARSKCLTLLRLTLKFGVKVPSYEQVKGYFQQFGIVENILLKCKDLGAFVVFSSISKAYKIPTVSTHSVSCHSWGSGPGR